MNEKRKFECVTFENLEFKPNIAIVGGGLGGLACALALQKEGYDVTVFERDIHFTERKQG